MDVIPVEQMNIAMLIRLVQMANAAYNTRVEYLDPRPDKASAGPDEPDIRDEVGAVLDPSWDCLDVNYQLPEDGEGGNDQTDNDTLSSTNIGVRAYRESCVFSVLDAMEDAFEEVVNDLKEISSLSDEAKEDVSIVLRPELDV
ncbi:hypothetical protein FPHYL_9477 [Fusarium phyllophilum]|uniref:Uncharacterized protein n=1 Tax=Fusarium phyllophilum TaxID=47803 RepID=A0A8H5N314_9HYPO|nr:hypothetical protein FPHYL_9477 [Fusarium phyllophilum]